MSSSLDYLDLCRLCLVKDRVSVPIFDGEGDVRQIFLKIAACLPVKVAREDKLPKKICGDCVYKVELLYQFWNTTANAEKQLLQWLGEVGLEDKQGYVTGVLNPQSTMKQEQSSPGGLAGATIQGSEAQTNIGIEVIDNMGIGMPLILPGGTQQQQLTSSPPINNNATPVPPVHQAVPGPSSQSGHNQLSQSQTDTSTRHQDDEEETSEEEENSDDDCDGDDGLPVKEESEEDPGNNRTIEPTTFVNVSLACDEAGPSGLQQQKITELPEMSVPQTVDGDPKSGYNPCDPLGPSFLTVKLGDDFFLIPKSLSVFMMKEPNPGGESAAKCDSKTEDTNTKSDEDDLDDTPLDFRRKLDANKDNDVKQKRLKLKTSYSCEICYVTFDRKSKLNSHMFRHSNSRPHKCKVCSKAFKTSSYLARHMDIHDEPLKLHSCTLCDFKARNKTYLKTHYIRKHTEDYNYSCEQCGKMFKVQSDYTTHVKDHDTESSCVCDICGTSYPSKSSLYFHKHYKHRIKVKEFECTTCRKHFKSQKNLDSHAELHKMKYVCEQCGMEFKFKYGLTKHLRTHSGEKSYLCAICGKTFGCLSSQKIHLLTHVGERPYVCDLCGQSFTQRSPMMLHRRKHPGVHPPPPPIKITNLLHGVQDKIIINKSTK